MPGRDGTGPMGSGPMSGRGAGFCAGHPMAGRAGRGRGRSFQGGGRGRGGGGWRHRFWQTGVPGWMERWPPAEQEAPEQLSPKAEQRLLRRRSKLLEQELGEIKQRLDELQDESAAGEPEAGGDRT